MTSSLCSLRERASSLLFLLRALISSWGLHPHASFNPNYLSKAPQMPTYWGLGFNLWILGGYKYSIHNRRQFCMSLAFLHVLWAEAMTAFWTVLSKLLQSKLLWKTDNVLSLEEKAISFIVQFNQENVSLWGKTGQICLQSIIKDQSFSSTIQPTTCAGVTWPLSCCPLGIGAQGTSARKCWYPSY